MSLHESLELDAIQHTTPKSPGNQSLELGNISAEQLGGFVVERIVRVGLIEQINQAVNDGVDVQNGLPVLPKDVETYLPLEIDVGMVDARFAVDLGRGVRVVIGDLEREQVRGTLPEPRVGSDGYVEGR